MIDKKIVHTNKEIFIKAINFQKKGNISEASKIYQSLIKIGFINPFLYFNYGLILLNEGKLVQAEKYFLKTIEIKPDFYNAQYSLGIVFTNLGKLKEAEISFLIAIEINPDYAKA